jgi:hypothetical protein
MQPALLRWLALAACSLPASWVLADPWLAPGESSLRSDLYTLADAGVLDAPVTAWPLPWAEIAANVADASAVQLDGVDLLALERVRLRARLETKTHDWLISARGTVAEDPTELRSFERTPRSDGEAGGAVSWTGDRMAFRLAAIRAWDPADGDTVRFDGSYIGFAAGNWMLSAGYPERWWGPGWDGSLLLSTNARPPPQISINRNFASPFSQRGFRWIGPWSLTSFIAQLDDERLVEDTLLFGLRVAAKPTPKLEIGLSRTAQFCGDGRPCDFETFVDMFFGNDNRGVNVSEGDEPGNQLGGLDVRWSLPVERLSTALYLQWIAEDTRQGGPQLGSWLREVGVEFSGSAFGERWRHRSYVELADTVCREGGAGFGEEKFGCAYEHSIYLTGYRYKGRSIGHSMDGDGRSVSAGSILLRDDREWRFAARHAELNRRGATTGHTLTLVPQDVSEVSVTHSRALRIGVIKASLGYRDTSGVDIVDDGSLFGWIEFVVN